MGLGILTKGPCRPAHPRRRLCRRPPRRRRRPPPEKIALAVGPADRPLPARPLAGPGLVDRRAGRLSPGTPLLPKPRTRRRRTRAPAALLLFSHHRAGRSAAVDARLPAAALILFRDTARRLLLRRLGRLDRIHLRLLQPVGLEAQHLYSRALPAVAILVGAAWADLDTAQFRWARFARGAFLLLLSVAGPGPADRRVCYPKLPIPGWALWPAGLAATSRRRLSSGAKPAGQAPRRVSSLWPPLPCLAVQGAVGLFIYPAVNPLKTPVELAAAVQERLPPGPPPAHLSASTAKSSRSIPTAAAKWCALPKNSAPPWQRDQKGIVVFEKRDFDAWPPTPPRLRGPNRANSAWARSAYRLARIRRRSALVNSTTI